MHIVPQQHGEHAAVNGDGAAGQNTQRERHLYEAELLLLCLERNIDTNHVWLKRERKNKGRVLYVAYVAYIVPHCAWCLRCCVMSKKRQLPGEKDCSDFTGSMRIWSLLVVPS